MTDLEDLLEFWPRIPYKYFWWTIEEYDWQDINLEILLYYRRTRQDWRNHINHHQLKPLDKSYQILPKPDQNDYIEKQQRKSAYERKYAKKFAKYEAHMKERAAELYQQSFEPWPIQLNPLLAQRQASEYIAGWEQINKQL